MKDGEIYRWIRFLQMASCRLLHWVAFCRGTLWRSGDYNLYRLEAISIFSTEMHYNNAAWLEVATE